MIRRDSITIISSLLMMVVLALAALCADAAQYISTIEDLQKIGNDSAWPLNGNYLLANDIDASATSGWNGGKGFLPLGTNSDPFTGSFDGQEHVITGLTINRTDQENVGLFGYINMAAFIINIGLEDCDITGSRQVGALAGHVYNTNIAKCYAKGTVTGNGNEAEAIGGLVGKTERGKINDSYAAVSVTVDGNSSQLVGGLVGLNVSCRITNCFATGTVTGNGDNGV